MEMSDKEFKQRMVLALASNPAVHDIMKGAQQIGLSPDDALVKITEKTCKQLNETCVKDLK